MTKLRQWYDTVKRWGEAGFDESTIKMYEGLRDTFIPDMNKVTDELEVLQNDVTKKHNDVKNQAVDGGYSQNEIDSKFITRPNFSEKKFYEPHFFRFSSSADLNNKIIHLRTNLKKASYEMFLMSFTGYNYGSTLPIKSFLTGYSYSVDSLIQSSILNLDGCFNFLDSTYYDDDNFLVVCVKAGYYTSFTIDMQKNRGLHLETKVTHLKITDNIEKITDWS